MHDQTNAWFLWRNKLVSEMSTFIIYLKIFMQRKGIFWYIVIHELCHHEKYTPNSVSDDLENNEHFILNSSLKCGVATCHITWRSNMQNNRTPDISFYLSFTFVLKFILMIFQTHEWSIRRIYRFTSLEKRSYDPAFF